MAHTSLLDRIRAWFVDNGRKGAWPIPHITEKQQHQHSLVGREEFVVFATSHQEHARQFAICLHTFRPAGATAFYLEHYERSPWARGGMEWAQFNVAYYASLLPPLGQVHTHEA
jgi:hypothetical protein